MQDGQLEEVLLWGRQHNVPEVLTKNKKKIIRELGLRRIGGYIWLNGYFALFVGVKQE